MACCFFRLLVGSSVHCSPWCRLMKPKVICDFVSLWLKWIYSTTQVIILMQKRTEVERGRWKKKHFQIILPGSGRILDTDWDYFLVSFYSYTKIRLFICHLNYIACSLGHLVCQFYYESELRMGNESNRKRKTKN